MKKIKALFLFLAFTFIICSYSIIAITGNLDEFNDINEFTLNETYLETYLNTYDIRPDILELESVVELLYVTKTHRLDDYYSEMSDLIVISEPISIIEEDNNINLVLIEEEESNPFQTDRTYKISVRVATTMVYVFDARIMTAGKFCQFQDVWTVEWFSVTLQNIQAGVSNARITRSWISGNSGSNPRVNFDFTFNSNGTTINSTTSYSIFG